MIIRPFVLQSRGLAELEPMQVDVENAFMATDIADKHVAVGLSDKICPLQLGIEKRKSRVVWFLAAEEVDVCKVAKFNRCNGR